MSRIVKISVERFEEILNGNGIFYFSGIYSDFCEGEIINLVAWQDNHYVYKQFLENKSVWTKCLDGERIETLTIKIIKVEKVSLVTLRVRIKIVNSLFGLVDEKRAKQNDIERRDYHRNQAKKKIGR
ncbi:hypothetical protein KF282_2520 [Lactococcus lactis subsp. lactis]|uniref:Uncharacterized protein n=1 Tax=Lactococcus lactis subsp. lactis TaxID=1360 RepID=A0A0V8CKS9_LACLL|nr:hypothetical protein [Lactococcus lactis]KSU01816.1 hypothetical protein KF282_2520 [Lactococcus lactis subsp. lactis]